MPRGTWVEPGMKPSLRRSRTSRMSRTWTSPPAISASTCSIVRFSIRVFASSTICPTVFLGFHIICAPSVLHRRTDVDIGQRAGGREAPDVPARALGQAIGRALESTEPAVDVALENARRVGHEAGFAQRLQARVAAALDEHRAAQGLLAVGGDDRRPRDAATIRIAHTPRMLAEQAGQARHSPSRPVGHGIDDHLDTGGRTAGRDGYQTEPEPSAQVAHVAPMDRHAPSATASRSSDREIDAVRQREPIDTLQQEREAEAQLQLDDHGWLVAARRHHITATNLRLDAVTLTLEERLDRWIEVALGGGSPVSPHRTRFYEILISWPNIIRCPSGVSMENSLVPHGRLTSSWMIFTPFALYSVYRPSTSSMSAYANQEWSPILAAGTWSGQWPSMTLKLSLERKNQPSTSRSSLKPS